MSMEPSDLTNKSKSVLKLSLTKVKVLFPFIGSISAGLLSLVY